MILYINLLFFMMNDFEYEPKCVRPAYLFANLHHSRFYKKK